MRTRESVVPQDRTGGANQTLRDLAGAEGGGFAVVWQDQRDGLLGVEVRRLDACGEPLEPEHPVHDCTSGRSLDPVVAVARDGSGTVAWISARSYLAPRVWLRSFDAQGRFVAPARPVEVARAAEKGAARGGASRPAIVRRRDGGYAIAWVEPAGIRMLEVDASGNWSDRPGTVSMTGSPPVAVGLGAAPRGGVLCAFDGGDAGDRWLATVVGKGAPPALAGPGSTRACGAGSLERLESDLADGFWAWFRTSDGPELRHLSSTGEPDRPPIRLAVSTEPPGSGSSSPTGEHLTDFAVWRGGIAVLETHEGGPLLLHTFDGAGKRLAADPIRATSPDARPIGDGRIASNGSLIYVAWTDRRNGDPDVYGRSFDPGANAETTTTATPADHGLGPETRLNSDEASSDQIRPALAAAGARVLVVWQDHRDVRAQVFARRRTIPDLLASADSKESTDEPEFQIPVRRAAPDDPARVGRAASGDPPRTHPAVAMVESGTALVAWTEGGPDEPDIRAQVLPQPGSPPRADVLVQSIRREPSRIAVAPLPDRRGFLLVFDAAAEGEIRSTRIGMTGEIASPPESIGGGAGDLLSDPAVAVLDDGRAIVCWSRRANGKAGVQDLTWSLRGRFLGADGAPEGKEIEFEPSTGGMDWEPALAPGPEGGFLLAWTAGTREAAVRGREWRDVVARAFDRSARPLAPLLPISPEDGEQDHPEIVRLADGSFAVAWEDDISGHDEAHLRRILKSGADLGPIVRMDSPSRGCALDHESPHIAPARSGLAALWSSSERSKGWDVVFESFGPRFDALSPR